MITPEQLSETGLRHRLQLALNASKKQLEEAEAAKLVKTAFRLRGEMAVRRHPSTVFGIISKYTLEDMVDVQRRDVFISRSFLLTTHLYVFSDPTTYFISDDIAFGGKYLFGPEAVSNNWHLEAYPWPSLGQEGAFADPQLLFRRYESCRRCLQTVEEIATHLSFLERRKNSFASERYLLSQQTDGRSDM